MADPTAAAACFGGPPELLEPDFAASGEQHGEPGSCCGARSSKKVRLVECHSRHECGCLPGAWVVVAEYLQWRMLD